MFSCRHSFGLWFYTAREVVAAAVEQNGTIDASEEGFAGWKIRGVEPPGRDCTRLTG